MLIEGAKRRCEEGEPTKLSGRDIPVVNEKETFAGDQRGGRRVCRRTESLYCEYTARLAIFSQAQNQKREHYVKKKQNVTTFVVVSLFLVLTCVRGENNHDARINVE